MKHILILAANPKDTTNLRLGQEVRDIDSALREASLREKFQLHQRWAVRTRDFQRALLDTNPNIVHFCGHGEGEKGIALEDASGQTHLVPNAALANLFALCAKQIDCVLLNACYAKVQAEAIVNHIDYVIGMQQAVPDDVAISFSTGFYKGLGAGQSIDDAFITGRSAIDSNSTLGKKYRKATNINLPGQPTQEPIAFDKIPVLKRRSDL
ncbi:MAG: CHAT domain-containing protein [Cyanobacteria bacterium P01_C01_bin.69]